MRILHVCPYMHPAAGGPPVVVGRFAVGAPKHGWEAFVLTTSLFCPDDGSALQRELESIFPIRILPADRPRFLGLASEAPRVIKAEVARADLVHIHTLWHPLSDMVRKACRRYDRPYLVMPHGMLDPWSLNEHRLRKRIYLFLREAANLAGAARIVFTTDEEESLARQSFPQLGPGCVVPLGADVPPNLTKVELACRFREYFPLVAGRRLLLYLGRIHPKKGLERIIELLPLLVQRYPKLLLVVAGDGEPAYLAALRARIEAAGCGRHVLFTGMLSGEAKWAAYAASEVFLLPSYQENFALVVGEAMQAAVPVIVTDKVNSWPYVEQSQGGIVIHGSYRPEALIAAIECILSDRETAKIMGEAGRCYAAETLTWERSVGALIECYARALQ